MKDVVFIFAHQDDEIGALPTLRREIAAGRSVWCAYLTDGARTVAATIRDAESKAFLSRFGVAEDRIGFIAADGRRIADGELVDHLQRADTALGEWLDTNAVQPKRVYALDWEGGHADHDAAHLIALSTGARRGCPVYVFSLYNAYNRPRKLFRVIDFIPGRMPIESRRISWSDAIETAFAPLAFPSQRRTWSALGGGLALRILWRRAERIRPADGARIATLPHRGPPLYETLFGHSADMFMAASSAYRSHLLEPGQVSRGLCTEF